MLTNNLKQGELTMLRWFVVPSCETHRETESLPVADIYQNRVNLKLEITGHWEPDVLMEVIRAVCSIDMCELSNRH